MKEINIMLVTHHVIRRQQIKAYLSSQQFTIFEASNSSESFDKLSRYPIDIVILGCALENENGLDVLRNIKEKEIDTEVIMISEHINQEDLIEALHLGACDYLELPLSLADFKESIEHTITNRKLAWQLRVTPEHITSKDIKYSYKGRSKAIREIHNLSRQVAGSQCNSVLLTGESGTGKELVARAIHNMSSRANHEFIAVNCSAIPDDLFESSFFGYNKGTFTGATEDRQGWFEMANNGTLMLDEIGDLKYGLQSKLLRVLDDMIIRRLGSKKEIKVDVRIIAATNQDLEKKISEGKFRADLYHRLTHFHIHLPPLRDRKEDIPVLLEHFVNYFGEASDKKIQKYETEIPAHLMEYNFPGNVRELRNMVERAMILCNSKVLKWKHFQPFFKIIEKKSKNSANIGLYTLDQIEETAIKKALENCGWNKTQAAKALNITRQALDRRILKHQIFSRSQPV